MNIKGRIKKISDAMRIEAEEADNAPLLTLEQWKRHADGEDIRGEIPENRRAEFDEYERIADERVREVEARYRSHYSESEETLLQANLPTKTPTSKGTKPSGEPNWRC